MSVMSYNIAILVLMLLNFGLSSSASISITEPEATGGGTKLNSSVFGELLQHSKSKKCLFPFDEREIIQNSSSVRKLNSLCNSSSIDARRMPERKQMCILIAEMLNSICESTQNVNSQDYAKLNLPFNISISQAISSQIGKTTDTFCTKLSQAERLPLKIVRSELQDFYNAFLLKTDDKQNSKMSCSTACRNFPDESTEGDYDLKISPLCIVFNATNIVYKEVEVKTRRFPNKSSTENQNLEQKEETDGMLDTIPITKRKDPDLRTNGKSSISAKDVEFKASSKSSGNQGQQDPQSLTKPPSKAISNSDSSIKSSSTSTLSSPGLNEPADNLPPLIKNESKDNPKTSSVSPAPDNAGKNIGVSPEVQSVNEKNDAGNSGSKYSKSPSSKNPEKGKVPLDKYDVGQLPSEGSVDSVYGDDIPPNLETGDAGSNDISIADGDDDDHDKTSITKKQNQNQVQETPNRKATFKYEPEPEDYDSGGYFNYFVFFLTIATLCFLAFHNKRRLLAYIVEGRKPRGQRTRRRSSSATGASYRRLENNFE